MLVHASNLSTKDAGKEGPFDYRCSRSPVRTQEDPVSYKAVAQSVRELGLHGFRVGSDPSTT